MPTRRTVLGGALAAAAAATPLVVHSRAHAATALPMTVVNDTGRYADGAIWMYVVGVDPTGRQGYVRTSGTFTPCQLSDNGPDGYADLSVALSSTKNLTLPHMSGRVYFSIGQKLRFRVVTDGAGRPALQYPAGWVSTDPNYPVMHDCVEFTFNNAGMFCNTSSVDMFSIPLAIRLAGNSTQTTGTLTSGARDRIFSAIRALPDFARLAIGSDNLRVVAPGHGINAGLFSPTYYDGYIGEVWSRYAGTDLRVSTNAGTVTGRVSGGNLFFSGGVAPFRRPTTKDVFFCDGALAAPNDGVTGPVAAVLGAAFNRSTLRDTAAQPTTDPAGFYRQPVTNHYSRLLHENTVDGKAYGFAFDDVVDFASYVQDLAPTSFTVTLTPFGAGGPGPGPTTPPPAGRDAYARIEAESHSQQSGTQTEACAEGGQNIGYVGNGDWVAYSGVDFGATPARQFSVRAASGAGAGISGLVEVRLDSRTNAPVGSVSLANTGGWQSWRTVNGSMSPVTGVHTVYLTFASGQPADYVNVNWLTFAR